MAAAIRSSRCPAAPSPTAASTPKKKIIELGEETQKRQQFFNVAQAKKFMQTFLVSDACKELIAEGKTTSIRDLYYLTKHTLGKTQQNTFEEQEESDPIIEDLEVTVDALREELHLFASNKGNLRGRADPGRLRRHHRRAAHGLRRLGGALHRRGGGHPVPQVRGQVHPAGGEGRGLPAPQRGPLLEDAPLHPDPRGRAAAPRGAAPAAPHEQGAEAPRLRAGRQRSLGLLHLLGGEAGLDQPGLREHAHGRALRALHRPLVLRPREVFKLAGQRHHQAHRR